MCYSTKIQTFSPTKHTLRRRRGGRSYDGASARWGRWQLTRRPGSGPRREGRPPRAHGRGGPGSNMYYTTSIHMSIGPTATGCRSLGSAYGKELKRRVIHPSSRRFASQTSCSCLFLAAAARPPGVRPTVRRRWCLVVRWSPAAGLPWIATHWLIPSTPQQPFAISNSKSSVSNYN